MRISRIALLALPAALSLAVGCVRHPAASLPADPAPRLGLNEFYKLPVGPKGLEPTDKLLSLQGKRVQVQGYMVREEDASPGLLMLTPLPASLAELADGPSDYLPPATLFVRLPAENAAGVVAYRPGLWNVAGTLDLGARPEINERISYVRLLPASVESVTPPGGGAPEFQEPGAGGHRHAH